MKKSWERTAAVFLSAMLLCGTVSVSAEEISGSADRATDTTVVRSGKSGDLDWTIDNEGLLTITGTGDYESDSGWSEYCSEITSAVVRVSGITSCEGMFYDCTNLRKADLSGLDTSHVTNMNSMFSECQSLENVDLSSMDTSQTTKVTWMFSDCTSLKSLNLSGMDWSRVTEAEDVFNYCVSLESLNTLKKINAGLSISLPAAGEGRWQWKDENGNTYTSISADEQGISLTRTAMPLSLRIAGVEYLHNGVITGNTCQGISYDADSNTLIMDNAEIQHDFQNGDAAIEMTAGAELNIELKGTNTISCSGTDSGGWNEKAGIKAYNLNISGNGILNIAGSGIKYGVSADKMTVENGTLNIENGIYTEHNFFLNNGTVNLKYKGISSQGSMTMAGGTLNVTESSGGINARNNVSITGGTVTVHAGESPQDEAYGIDVSYMSSSNPLTIENAEVFMDLGNVTERLEYFYCSTLTIRNSVVECHGQCSGKRRTTIDAFPDKDTLSFEAGSGDSFEQKSFEEIFALGAGWWSNSYGVLCDDFRISPKKQTSGDLNGDGTVNIMDMMQSLNYVSKKGQLTEEQFAAADINGDGKVNLTDLMLLLNYISKKSSHL